MEVAGKAIDFYRQCHNRQINGGEIMPERTTLPALVTRGVVPLPNNDFRLEVGRPFSVKALRRIRSELR